MTEERIEKMEEALRRIIEWSDAYPIDVFVPPTSEQFKAAHAALVAIGLSLDKFSAEASRHAILGIGRIARAALEP